MKRIRLAIVIVFMTASSISWGQSDNDLYEAQGSLDKTLVMLRESVVRLTEENKVLSAENQQARLSLSPLDSDLKAARAEEIRLMEKLQKLEEQFQKKSEEAERFQEQLEQVLRSGASAKAFRDATEEKLQDRQKDEAALEEQLAAGARELQEYRLGVVPDVDKPEKLAPLHAEIASLQKEFDDSAAVLDGVRREWTDFNDVVMMGLTRLPELRREQDELRRQVEQSEQEVAKAQALLVQVRAKADNMVKDAYPGQDLSDLEKDVSVLEVQVWKSEQSVDANDKELALRLKKMEGLAGQKRRKSEKRMRDLEDRNRYMREEVAQLQKEMIALDRKKSDLEKQGDR